MTPPEPPRRAALAATALLLAALAACKKDPAGPPPEAAFRSGHASAVASNGQGLVFTIATHDGRARFALGEPIQIDLRFSTALENTYQIDLNGQTRSVAGSLDSFFFDNPKAVTDPFAEHYKSNDGSFATSSQRPPLSAKPTVVTLTLNEWVRFSRPGPQRVYVLSDRVSTKPGVSPPASGRAPTASENVLSLEIVDDPAWSSKELARIKTALDKGGSEDEQNRARDALRFLMTPAATHALVDELCRARKNGSEYPWQIEAGLQGAPDRALVRAALREAITRPDCAVSARHLDLLARLDAATMKPEGPPYPFAVEREKLEQTLVGAIGQKTPEALPLSALTALRAVGARDKGAGAASEEAAALRARLAGRLDALPDAALSSLLADQWTLVKTPALVPALTALVNEARPRGGQLRSISDLALERLVELDYDAARTFLVAELARPARTSFSGATLGLLKETELAALDTTLAAGLRAPEHDAESIELRAEVFARYASRAPLKEAWAAYKDSSYFRVSLLSYLARHDAKAASAEIARLDIDSLRRLSRFAWTPAMEAACVASLDGASLGQAADLLAERGGAAAEKSLWERLTSRCQAKQQDGQGELRRAITHGKGWVTPPDRLKALAALCGEPHASEVRHLVDRWGEDGKRPELVLWSQRASGGLTGWIAHHDVRSLDDVRSRISQLPAGVTLVWKTAPAEVDADVMVALHKAAEARQIEIAAPR